jgi:hypothetical protein
MATTSDLLVDGFERVQETVREAVEGLDEDALAWRPDAGANSIAWLVWHLTRIMDDHVAAAAGGEQVWTGAGWVERFGLPFDVGATGYGHSAAEVGRLRAGDVLLTAYQDAVHGLVVDYVRTLDDEALDRVVDERWDPPVTLAVRLVSVLDDAAQHAGQASYVRGLLERRA